MHTGIHAEVEVNTLLLIVIPLMAWFYSADCQIVTYSYLNFKLDCLGWFFVFLFEHWNQVVGNTAYF